MLFRSNEFENQQEMTLRVLSKLVSIIEYPVLLYTGLATHDLIGLEIVDVRQYLPPKQYIMTQKQNGRHSVDL